MRTPQPSPPSLFAVGQTGNLLATEAVAQRLQRLLQAGNGVGQLGVVVGRHAQHQPQLRLPRRPDQLSIESSDLQADARRENLIVLNAVIRNRAPFAQEHPALELTLTDTADKALVRRVLRPPEYMQAAEQLAQGIGPGGEAVVRVHFDTRGVRATGYRLYLFYPS